MKPSLFIYVGIKMLVLEATQTHYSDVKNGRDSVSNHQPHDCLLNRFFRRRSKQISNLRFTGLCAGNSPVISEFPAQMASNAETVSIWWRHHALLGVVIAKSVSSYSPFWVLSKHRLPVKNCVHIWQVPPQLSCGPLWLWSNGSNRCTTLINLCPASVAYMRHWIGSALLQKMACWLFGAKPLSKPMLDYC